MTKVKIEPGVCGFLTAVEAQADEDQTEVQLTVKSGCDAVRKMMEEVGDTFDPMELCLCKPGCDPLTQWAGEHFPVHAGCPVISGIIKCAEAEAGLALKKDCAIHFVD
jgi:hypothetical protein